MTPTNKHSIAAQPGTSVTRKQIYLLSKQFVYPPCKKKPDDIRIGDDLAKDLGYVGNSKRLLAPKTNNTFAPQPPNYFTGPFSAAYRDSGAMSKGTFASSGEFEWEPMRNRAGDFISIDGPEQPPAFWPNAPFNYRLTINGRLEFGDPVVKTDSGHFVKGGPKAALTITPRAFDQLQFFASYVYLWEVPNNSADFDLFEIGARLALDENKQFSLEVKYRLGQVPAKYTDIDIFQVSLGAKF